MSTGEAPPAACPECGGAWVFKAPWWESPAPSARWGYLVHCAALHFTWYEAALTEEEKAAARQRLQLGPRASAEE